MSLFHMHSRDYLETAGVALELEGCNVISMGFHSTEQPWVCWSCNYQHFMSSSRFYASPIDSAALLSILSSRREQPWPFAPPALAISADHSFRFFHFHFWFSQFESVYAKLFSFSLQHQNRFESIKNEWITNLWIFQAFNPKLITKKYIKKIKFLLFFLKYYLLKWKFQNKNYKYLFIHKYTNI